MTGPTPAIPRPQESPDEPRGRDLAPTRLRDLQCPRVGAAPPEEWQTTTTVTTPHELRSRAERTETMWPELLCRVLSLRNLVPNLHLDGTVEMTRLNGADEDRDVDILTLETARQSSTEPVAQSSAIAPNAGPGALRQEEERS